MVQRWDQGHLYFSIGDRGTGDDAQNTGKPNGKIHRIQTDGKIPADNPFVKTAGALPSIYSFGHRNHETAQFILQPDK
ncbi:MAG: PQQ-dependent sugar dehydrogenase [Saprospiraceae bacterium]|nr:PQQ-dependent sugar dehydrogenase [Saprospiraceae bacterium]